MDRRYQIFISSTYEDLRAEREGVVRALLGIDCIPASMEAFGAASTTPWDIIKTAIDLCDYYLVITAGKYGSEKDGISYTEREYDYAKSIGIPCLAFIHVDPGSLPSKATESDPGKKQKLADFHQKLSDSHLLEKWNNADDLKYRVVASLTNEMKRSPRSGWVKATEAADTDLYKRVEELRLENDDLRRQLAFATNPSPDSILEEMEEFVLEIGFYSTDFDKQSQQTAEKVLIDQRVSIESLAILDVMGEHLYKGTLDGALRVGAANLCRQWYNERAEAAGLQASERRGALWRQFLDKIMIESLMVLDRFHLLRTDKVDVAGHRGPVTYWSLTDFGRRVYAHFRLSAH